MSPLPRRSVLIQLFYNPVIRSGFRGVGGYPPVDNSCASDRLETLYYTLLLDFDVQGNELQPIGKDLERIARATRRVPPAPLAAPSRPFN
ncbi:hypothetical protein GOBAR_AA00101 [Gossypium barbadense]|uniref:Uncharacterized protein n=1 Tax=Gossypium barbadense TaxID=3634 RepID=A0A2P5YY33_GOSBA|nr:hypothetical protein GOBAR_AA00101 [Gossypium barbadense]